MAEDKQASGSSNDTNKLEHILTLPTFPEARQLDGTNYALWKVQMAADDLAEFITVGIPCPNLETEESEALLWDKLNARMRSFIVLKCHPPVLNHTKHLSSTHAICEFLDTMYLQVTPTKCVPLEVQLCRLYPTNSSILTKSRPSIKRSFTLGKDHL